MKEFDDDFWGQNSPLGKLVQQIKYLNAMVLAVANLSGIDGDVLHEETMRVLSKNHDEPPSSPEE